MSFLYKNLGLKFISLLLAASFWVYVAANESKTDLFPGDIPIVAKSVKEGLAPVYDAENTKVKIMASSDTWSHLLQEDFVAYVDLKDLSLGTHEVEVKVTSTAAGVQIVEVNPSKILVRLEREVSKEVSVVIKLEGSPAEGYGIINTKVNPTQAEAKGAESIIDSVRRGLALVQLNGEATSFEKEVSIIARSEEGKNIRNIRFNPDKANVGIKILPQNSGKTVGIKVKTKGLPKDGYWITKVTVEPPSVNILGEEKILNEIDNIETKEVDISGLSSKETFSVEFNLPENVSLASGEPNKCDVTITVATTEVSSQVIVGISYTGLISGLKVDGINPSEIKAVVVGERGRVNILSADNVVLMIDLSGKQEGSHRIDITKSMISIPSGITVSSVVPSSITITLSQAQ